MGIKCKLRPRMTQALAMRSVNIVNESANPGMRSIRVVTATENPIPRYDEERKEVVNEVLAMDGLVMRPGRTQLPIVDSHDQSTVRNILGSLRNVRIEGDEFGGDAYFASDSNSQEAFTKLSEGHLSDFSITADPIETIHIKRGQSYTLQSGKVIEGPANIITKWTPLDASLVACGADDRSTVRRSYLQASDERQRSMDEMTFEPLKALGLPDGMTDSGQVVAWIMGKFGSSVEPMPAIEAEPIIESAMETPPTPIENMTEDLPKEDEMDKNENAVDVASEVKRALEADLKRRKEIHADCQLLGIDREFADELCDSGVDLASAKDRIIKRAASKQKELGSTVEGSDLRFTASEDDKFLSAARDGVIMRAMRSANVQRPAFDNGEKPSAGHEDFARQDLFRIAESCLQRAKIDTRRMTKKDVALVAMGSQSAMQRLRIQREAYHSTGSFSSLMLDAANKTLRAGYEEAVYSYSMWTRQGTSASDLKALNRIMFSEFANLQMVPEGTEYPENTMSDFRESYKVEKFGANFSVTWETVVNDDLDAISRIPALQGNAAKRTVNAKAYEVLTSNPIMSDTYNLFSTSHASGSNYQTTGAAPSVTTLNAGYLAMATQKGVNSTVVLNITPRYLIVPRALEATALALINSTADPAAGGSAVGNSGNANLYGPGGPRRLQVVSDAVLDGSSTQFWYLAASPNEIDTVEVTFLQGEESPVLESEWEYKTDTWNYKIRQTFAAKAIDWRGLYCNDGA